MNAPIRPATSSVREVLLYVAFELSAKQWKLALTSGFGIDPWVRTIPAGDLRAVARVLHEGRRRFQLAESCGVVSCYEAGRDGFWIHRALTTLGLANRIVDSASIEVNRRARRTKTDRVDALKLVRMLVRWYSGDRDVWQEVRVPSAETEAARQVSRERTALVKAQTRLMNQMRSWVPTWGAQIPRRRRAQWWTEVRDWAGAALPPSVQARLAHAEARLTLLETQLADVEHQQHTTVAQAPADAALTRLVQLKGVAVTSASVLVDEGLVWRAFRNRREVGGLLGFVSVPFQSGETAHDQGISRAGNTSWRAISIQLAWNWVRWQPTSALTRWYRDRFSHGKRLKRLGIVALARKLVIALWRYAVQGIVPAGAVLKTASSAATVCSRVLRVRLCPGLDRDRYREGTAAGVAGPKSAQSLGAAPTVRARIEGERWIRPPLKSGPACSDDCRLRKPRSWRRACSGGYTNS